MWNLQALLIGIDRYGEGPSRNDLHGAVADLEAMRALLLRCRVPRENLRCLVSSHDEARNRPSTAPTYENMVDAIRHLGERAHRTGSEALIYYSGHGGRTKTLIPGAKGGDGVDEGLVPWNLHEATARLLHDVELTHLLTELARSGVPITLVVDACHSGGVVRKSSRQGRPKRLREAFPDPEHGSSRVAPEAELEKTWRRVHLRSTRPFRHSRRPSSGWTSKGLLQRSRVGVLAACRQTEVAYERDFGTGPRGAFTYYLVEAFAGGAAAESWDGLQRWMARKMRRSSCTQWPVFEGSASPALLARLARARDQPIQVLEVDAERRRILLDVGAAFGVCPGARLEVGSAGGRGPRVQARVEQVSAAEAWAVAEERVATIRPGDEGKMLETGNRRLRVAAVAGRAEATRRRVLRNGRRVGERGEQVPDWRERLREEVSSRGEGWVEWVSSEGPSPDLLVSRGADRYRLLDGAGEPLPAVPEVSHGPRAARRQVDQLLHLARFFWVRDLANRDSRSELAGLVRAELGLLPRGWRPESPYVAEERVPERVQAGRWVLLEIENHSGRELHLFVLDLRPDWSVEIIHPKKGLETLEGGRQLALPFEIFLPPGHSGGRETLKVLATTSPNRPRILRLPALGRTPRRVVRGARSTGGERWRSSLFRRAHDHWTTADVDFEVVPRAAGGQQSEPNGVPRE